MTKLDDKSSLAIGKVLLWLKLSLSVLMSSGAKIGFQAFLRRIIVSW
jgi:hypothetical protein